MISEADLPENWRELLDAELAEYAAVTRRIHDLCYSRDRSKERGERRVSSGPGVVPSLVQNASGEACGTRDDTRSQS